MVGLSNLRENYSWDIVRSWKLKHLIENVDLLPKRSCFVSDSSGTLEDDRMSYNLMEIEKEFLVRGSKHNNFDLNKNTYTFTEVTLNESAKMFIYLNLCPKFLYDWIKLYIDLLQNAPTDVIVQTLNRIMITGKTKKDRIVVEFSKNIFTKITNELSLQYQSIEHFSKGYEKNATGLATEKTSENTNKELNELNFQTNIGMIKSESFFYTTYYF